MNNSENTEKNEKIPPPGRVYDEKGRAVFAPGVSGNPAGKPKGTKHLTSLLFEALQKQAKEGKTYQDLLVERILNDAIIKGKGDLIKLAWNYIDGMPEQGVDITSGGEKIEAPTSEVMKMAEEIRERLRAKKMD